MKDKFIPTTSKASNAFIDTIENKGTPIEREYECFKNDFISYFIDGKTDEDLGLEFDGDIYHLNPAKDRKRADFIFKHYGILIVRIWFEIPKEFIYGHLFGIMRDKVRFQYEEWKKEFDEENSKLFITKNEEKKVITFLEKSDARGYAGDETGLLDDKYKKEVREYIDNFYTENFNKTLNKK